MITLFYLGLVVLAAAGVDRYIEHNLVNKSAGTPDATIGLIRIVSRLLIALITAIAIVQPFV